MWQFIRNFLNRLGLGFLGVLFRTVAEAAQKAGLDDDIFVALGDLVHSAEQNPLLTTKEERWKWVWNQSVDLLKVKQMVIATSLLKTALEMLVHNAHWGEGGTKADAIPKPLEKIE